MWKSFIWVLILLGVLSGILILERNTSAIDSLEGWAGKNVRILAQSPVTGVPANANTCSGTVLSITIRNTGDTEACILGELGKTHLARYTGANYQYAYAIAIGDETTYTRIDNFCSGLAWCAYSSSSDTLLMSVKAFGQGYGTTIIKDFTRYLQRHVFIEPHYTFSYDGQPKPVSIDTLVRPTGAVAVSQNGRWAFVELQEYGFIRLDMKTGDFRRVVAPGFQYGIGADPAFELAISNDGRFAAVAGWGSGLTVYQMDNGCGDMLSETSGRHFAQGVIACQQSSINYSELFPGFVFAEMPRFSEDGLRLSLLVLTRSSVIRTSITPLPLGSVSAVPLYVALGDSFVSGEGETDDSFYILGTNTTTNRCHVSSRSYPYLLYPKTTKSVVNKACSGSRIEEVHQQAASITSNSESQPLDSISVGVGGNDIDVMGKLKTCISSGTCEWALAENRHKVALEIQRLFPKVVHLLKSIHQEYPSADVYFVGYPEVINDTQVAQCRFPISVLLTHEERQFMNETIGYLNDVLRAAALHAAVPFVDVGTVYEGERLCDSSEAAMNGIRMGDDFAPIASLGSIKVVGAESFHPTPRGHELVASRIREKYDGMQGGTVCVACGVAVAPTPPSYWRMDDHSNGTAQLIAGRFLKNTVIAAGDMVAFSFPSHSFKPRSTVKLELHSETRLLGEFTATDKGGLEGIVKLPSNSTGYHAVHALGFSASEEVIDRYEVVYIKDIQDAGQPVSTLRHQSERHGGDERIGLVRSDSTVEGVMTTQKEAGAERKAAIREIHPNWLAIWSIGGAMCLISTIFAYSIGRRRV